MIDNELIKNSIKRIDEYIKYCKYYEEEIRSIINQQVRTNNEATKKMMNLINDISIRGEKEIGEVIINNETQTISIKEEVSNILLEQLIISNGIRKGREKYYEYEVEEENNKIVIYNVEENARKDVIITLNPAYIKSANNYFKNELMTITQQLKNNELMP